jgi:hypothetical protein
MKITTNPIGNYGIHSVKNAKSPSQVKKVKVGNIDISRKEKKFFAEMYPAEKEKVMSYHFYNKSGKFGGVAIGNNIDLRG